MLAGCTPGGAQGVDLIEEDDCGRLLPSQVKQSAHHPLRLSPASLPCIVVYLPVEPLHVVPALWRAWSKLSCSQHSGCTSPDTACTKPTGSLAAVQLHVNPVRSWQASQCGWTHEVGGACSCAVNQPPHSQQSQRHPCMASQARRTSRIIGTGNQLRGWAAPVLGAQGGSRHVEEGGVALCGHSLGQHGFACARRPKEQHTL